MPFHITVLYAGLNGLLILVLTVRVVLTRRAVGIGLGTGGNAALERASCIHGNAIESIPTSIFGSRARLTRAAERWASWLDGHEISSPTSQTG